MQYQTTKRNNAMTITIENLTYEIVKEGEDVILQSEVQDIRMDGLLIGLKKELRKSIGVIQTERVPETIDLYLSDYIMSHLGEISEIIVND